MNKKYTGSNASALDYLHPRYKSLYNAGFLSDSEVDGLLTQAKTPTKPTVDSIMAGPLTEGEEQSAKGLVSAGGDNASTSRAAAANLSSSLRDRGEGVGRILSDGSLADADFLKDAAIDPFSAVAIPGARVMQGINSFLLDKYRSSGVEQEVKDAISALPNRLLPDSVTTKEGREKADAFRDGRGLSVQLAKDRAGELGKLAIDVGPNASQAATTVAALIASKNPRLAATIGRAGLTDIGTQVIGQGYIEGQNAGLSDGNALTRTKESLAIELATEMLNPAFDSVKYVKTLIKATGTGAAQEVVAEAGNMLLDYAKYPELAPKSAEEVEDRLTQAAKLGAVFTGAISAPATLVQTRGTRADRLREAAAQFTDDPDVAAGMNDGLSILEATEQKNKKSDPPVQLDLESRDADGYKFVKEEGPAAPGTGYVPSPDRGGNDVTKYVPEDTTPPISDSGQLELGLNAPKQPKVTSGKASAEARQATAAKKEAAKQKAKETNIRKQEQDKLLKEQPDLTPLEFDAIVGLRTKKRLKEDAASGKATAKPKASTTVKPIVPPKKDIKDVSKTVDDDAVYSLLPDEPSKPKGISNSELAEKFVNDESKDGYRFRAALRSGKVKVVRNLSSLEEFDDSPVVRNAKGVHFNKDGQIYLASDNLTKQDLMGTLLHEATHHGINKAKGDKVPRGMAGIFGEGKVAKLADQIEGEAATGNKAAERAMKRYNIALKNLPDGTSREEILTYFIEEVKTERDSGNSLGKVDTILKDALSSARVGIKNLVGLQGNINVNDLQLYANKMVDDLGKSKKAAKFADPNYKVEDEEGGSFSFIGTKSGLMGDDRLVTPFVGADGKPRREIDASGFKVDKQASDKLFNEGSSTVGELFSNADILTKEAYDGALASIPVKYEPGQTSASWDGTQIVVGTGYKTPAAIKSVLLHEVQHAIQQKEGFAVGSSVDAKLSETDKATIARAKEKIKSMSSRVIDSPENVTAALKALGPAISEVKPRGRSTLQALADGSMEFDSSLAKDSFNNLMGDIITAQREGKLSDSSLKAIAGNRTVRSYMYNMQNIAEVSDPAFQAYLNELGEVEARAVQQRSGMTKAEREAQPDPLKTVEDFEGRSRKNFTKTTKPADASFSLPGEVSARGPRGFGKGGTVKPKVVPLTKGKIHTTRDGRAGRARTLFASMFINNVPKAFEEIQARQLGETNSYALDALTSLNSVNEAISNYANPEQAVKMLKEYEQAAEDAQQAVLDNKGTKDAAVAAGRAARVAMAKRLKQEMPAVFEEYNKARRKIFKMSQDIVYLMEKEGYSPNDKELSVIASIKDNMGNYLTTTYKAHGPKNVRAEHIRYLYGTEKGKETRDAAYTWARDNIFTFNKLEDKSTQWLEALYDAVGPGEIKDNVRSASQLDRSTLIDLLSTVEKIVPDSQLDTAATRFVEDLLTVGKSANAIGRAARIYRGSKQDTTIITAKTDVPKAIRDLWGEQNNPVMNVFATLVKQGEFIAKAKSQHRMLEELDGLFLFDNYVSVPGTSEAVQLTSDAHGPLAGKWTTPEVKAFLEAEQDINKSFAEIINMVKYNNDYAGAAGGVMNKALNGLGTVGGNFKWLSVVWRPINWVYNYGGSWAQMTMNGNYGKYAATAHGIAFREAPNAPFKKVASEALQELIRNGLLDSSLAGEIQERERQSIIQGIMEKGEDTIIKHSKLKRFTNGVTDVYAATDIWAKIANYLNEKDFVKEYYKARGENLSKEDLERLAAQRIRRTNFSFDQAFGPAKFFEKSGITNFLTYNAEVIRTTINNFRQGFDDVIEAKELEASNPKAAGIIRAHGIKRLTGAAATSVLGSTAFMAIAQLVASSIDAPEEDEKERGIMAGVSDMFSGGLLKLMSIDGDKREYFDAGRLDPYGPLTEITRAVASGDVDRMKKTATGLWITNEILREGISAMAAAIEEGEQRGKPPRFKGTAPDVYALAKDRAATLGISDSVADRSLRLAESMTPSILGTLITQMMSDEENSPAKKLLLASGGRLVTYDPREDLSKDVKYNYKTTLKDNQTSWSNWLGNIISPSDQAIRSKFYETANDEFEAWSKLLPKINAAKLAGLSPREIQNQLKDASLNQEQINGLTRGKFYPSVLTVSKLNADEASDIKAAGDDKEAINRIKDKYKKIRPLVSRLNRNYIPYEE